MSRKNGVEISMIGTLPPLKGISPYCAELVSHLDDHIYLEFIDFKRLYPENFYPGGTISSETYPFSPNRESFCHKRVIDIYNPLSWIKAGIGIRGNVVHAQWWSGVLAPVFLVILSIARLRKKKVVITVHNVEPHEKHLLLKLLNDSVLLLGDEFIVHNNNNAEIITKKLKGKSKKIHVISHIPFRSARCEESKEEKEKLRKELGIADSEHIMIFYGNIREYKGLDVLLRAIPLLTRKYADLKLIIVGQVWGKWDPYQRIIDEERIGDYLIMDLHYQPFTKLCRYISIADISVFPFKTLESASGSLVLAKCLGKPVVISDLDCIRDLGGGEVFTCRPNCPRSLAEAIDRAFESLDSERLDRRTKYLQDLQRQAENIVDRHLVVYSLS